MSLTLKSGKFYDSFGNVVPLEHGNQEQLSIMRKHQDRLDDLNGDGLEVEPVFTVYSEVHMACICNQGVIISFKGEGDDNEEACDNMHNKKQTCHKCKRIYKINHIGSTATFINLIKP